MLVLLLCFPLFSSAITAATQSTECPIYDPNQPGSDSNMTIDGCVYGNQEYNQYVLSINNGDFIIIKHCEFKSIVLQDGDVLHLGSSGSISIWSTMISSINIASTRPDPAAVIRITLALYVDINDSTFSSFTQAFGVLVTSQISGHLVIRNCHVIDVRGVSPGAIYHDGHSAFLS